MTAAEQPRSGGQLVQTALHLLKIFTLNSWRRLVMLGHYTLICLHQQRFRRAARILGQQVIQSLDSGEVNPLLAGEVRDSVARAQEVKKTKDRHYQAIAALREKIRATRSKEAPPAPEAGAAPAETGPEATQEKGERPD